MAGISIDNSPNFSMAGPTTTICGGNNDAHVAPTISSAQTLEGNVMPTVGAAAGSMNAHSNYAPQLQRVSAAQSYYAPQSHTLWNEQHSFAPHMQAVAQAPQAAALPPLPAAPPGYTIVRDASGMLRMLPVAVAPGVPPPAQSPYPQANAAQQPMVTSIQQSWPQPMPFAGSSQHGCPVTMQPPQLQPQPQQPFHVAAALSYGVPQQHGAGVPVGAAQPQAAAQPGGLADASQQPLQAAQQPPASQTVQAVQQPPPVQAMQAAQQPPVPQPAPAAEQPPAPQPVQVVQQPPPAAQPPHALACPASVPQPTQSSVAPPSQPQGLAGWPAAEPSALVVPAADAPSAPPMTPGLFTAA